MEVKSEVTIKFSGSLPTAIAQMEALTVLLEDEEETEEGAVLLE